MTKKQCPMCEEILDVTNLTVSYLAGAEDAHDRAKARIEALEAKLAKAVVALRETSSFLWHMTNAIDDEDYKGTHDGFNVPLVCHVQLYHDLHVEQLKTQAEKVNATLAEIEGGKG